MPNGRYCGGRPQGGEFYSPYSKNIQWGQGVSELVRNLMMMKEFRQAQKKRRNNKGVTRY